MATLNAAIRDPTTGGRRRSLLCHLLSPPKCASLENLSSFLESWEAQLRLYEGRRRQDGTRHTLDSEMKMSVLEAMCAAELERRLQMNRAKYTSYGDMRSEIVRRVQAWKQ